MEVFNALALVAILIGGAYSASSARRPSRFAMWAVAYLVLVVGLVQLGLVLRWQQLHLVTTALVIIAFVIFNMGNVAVIVGRFLKGKRRWARYVVYTGGALLALAMVLLICLALQAGFSWNLVWFLVIVGVILVSMPIGVTLSARNCP